MAQRQPKRQPQQSETTFSSSDRDVKSSSERKPNRKERRSKGKNKDDSKFYAKTKGSNALAWHTPDMELLRRSAELSWAYQTGELLAMNTPIYGPNSGQPQMTGQAGVIVIHDHISIGGAGYLTDTQKLAVSQLPSYNAANTLLTEMRSRARLRNTYDAPDVFMINMAMANIYAGVILAKRLAGTVRMFTYKNTYLPEVLIQAQGFNPDWFKANQFRFVTELNILISEINKVYIPNRMHIFELINERFSNYYSEGTDIKDQLYVITPAFLSIFDPNGSANWASQISPYMCMPGKMLNYGLPGQGGVTQYDLTGQYTGDDLLHALRRMLENVLMDSTTADITGDMANCFGESERFYLPFADPSAIVTPVFDEEILETIHNMSWSRAVSEAYWNFDNQGGVAKEDFKIIQDPVDNRIGTWDAYGMSDSTFKQAQLEAESAFRILDVHKDPSPEKTFAITRLRNITGMRTVAGSTIWTQIIFGSDLICGVDFWYFTDNNGALSLIRRGYLQTYNYTSTTDVGDEIRLSPFHYRPMRLPVNNAGTRTQTWPTGESDIFAQIGDSMTIENMNRISLLTLLGAYNNLG